MSVLAPDRWEVDPDELAAAALEAPRCRCERPIVDEYLDCQVCGREVREPGSLGREFRRAAYERRLSWARGSGLDARSDFRGLSREVGPNPELSTLDAALMARVDELAAVGGDPFEGTAALIAA